MLVCYTLGAAKAQRAMLGNQLVHEVAEIGEDGLPVEIEDEREAAAKPAEPEKPEPKAEAQAAPAHPSKPGKQAVRVAAYFDLQVGPNTTDADIKAECRRVFERAGIKTLSTVEVHRG